MGELPYIKRAPQKLQKIWREMDIVPPGMDITVTELAPEWMSEKAMSIALYFMLSGVDTICGVGNPVGKSKNVTELLATGFRGKTGGSLRFITDIDEMYEESIKCIEKKRAALNLKAERVLMSMADRRQLDKAARCGGANHVNRWERS